MFRIPQPPLVGRRRRLSRWRLPPSLSLNLPLVCPFRLFPRRPLSSEGWISQTFLILGKCGAKVWGKSVGQQNGMMKPPKPRGATRD